MRRQRRGTKLLALMTGVSLLAAACGDDDEATEAGTEEDGGGEDAATEEVVPEGELVDLSSFAGDPPSHLDPLLSTTVSASQVNDTVYDGLTAIDYSDPANPEVRGVVAESWESNDDATEWTFQLREGLSFSNGDPVLPSSFKHGWEVGAEYAGNYGYLYGFIDGGQAMLDDEADDISGVEADDDAMTLTVTLSEGWAEFDAVVGFHTFYPMPESREMPPDDVNPDEINEWETDQMIGNGPYMLESWEPDFSEVVMVPNPEWDGTLYDEELALPNQPYIERITFVASDDIEAAFNAFEAGQGDIAAIPSGQVQYATDNYQTLLDNPSLGAYYFQINQRNEMVGGEENVLLRRAIMQAIDREDINEVVYDNTRVSATGITPEGIPGFQEGICEYCTYDPEAAEEDFQAWQDEGNSLDGPIPIQFNAGFGHEDVVSIIVENLAAVGIEAEPDPRDSDTYFDDLANGECVICRAGWLADYPTYGNFMTDLFHSRALDQNNYGYTNDDFDALLDEAQVETDEEARGELYREAESLLLNEDAGAIPINWYRSTRVYNPDIVSELYEDPSFHVHWETVQLAE